MEIKSQDIVILAKLIAKKMDKNWSQNTLAHDLCLSPSEINRSFKRLVFAKLLTPYQSSDKPQPILQASEEFFLHGLKYAFPAETEKTTRGVPTSYAAPSFKNEISLGDEPIPVWPYGEGKARGVALKPLHPAVPESVTKYPDPLFYDLLTLIDAIRSGRARERQIAAKHLSDILNSNNKK